MKDDKGMYFPSEEESMENYRKFSEEMDNKIMFHRGNDPIGIYPYKEEKPSEDEG